MNHPFETRRSTFEARLPIEPPTPPPRPLGSKFFYFRFAHFDFLHRFRLPRREGPELARNAARNRVERLFEVNFRSSWTR